jgi:exopolysaccharide biosynthesis protein
VTPIAEQTPDLSSGYLLERGIDPENLILINNTGIKKTSEELIKSNNCSSGINGGFYGTDDKPVGWMVINNEQISKPKESTLFNGYIIIDNSAFDISNSPKTGVLYGLQTGPLLVSNGKPWKLDLIRDKPARRMVMGTADDGIFLLAVFNGEAETTGPQLMDLPSWVMQIADKEKLIIDTAINLDGGGASAFYSTNVFLKESSSVGSWWCVTNQLPEAAM